MRLLWLLVVASLAGCVAPDPAPARDRIEERHLFAVAAVRAPPFEASYEEPIEVGVGPSAALLVVDRNATGPGGFRVVGPRGEKVTATANAVVHSPSDGVWRVEPWWAGPDVATIEVRILY